MSIRDDLMTIIDDYLEAPAIEGATIRQEAEMLLDRLLARLAEPSEEMQYALRAAMHARNQNCTIEDARAAWAAALRAV